MIKAIVGLALLAAAIAYGVRWTADQATRTGPTTVRVEVPNPMGGDTGDGGAIYVP